MTNLLKAIVAVPLLILANVASADEPATILNFESLEDVPGGIGFAGPFVGVDDETLVVAGGANFPGTPLWETEKVFYDAIHVLDLSDDNATWQTVDATLPMGALAYGVSLTHPEFGAFFLGGSDGSVHSAQCVRLAIENGAVRFDEVPALPKPLAYAAGAIVGNTIYVVGGQEDPTQPIASQAIYALNLPVEDGTAWRAIESIPGAPGRIIPVAGSHGGALYVFSGCALNAGPQGETKRTYLRDVWRFDPDFDPKEEVGSAWTERAQMPRASAAAPTPALNLGNEFLAIIGGDDGANTTRVNELRDAHPGFPSDVLAYHTLTDKWTTRAGFPKDAGPDPQANPNAGVMPPVTTSVVAFDGAFIVPSGEIRPRVRSPRVWRASLHFDPPRFAVLDWIAIGVYLASLIALGLYFSRRERSTEDFFFGGRRVPWWAAGISIFATQLSAITFMAIPAKSYATDWTYFIQSFGIFAMAPVVVYFFLPFFRRLKVPTAYAYLERRFSSGVRMFGSAQYLLFQFGRMAIVVYLPALALAAVTGLDVHACILVMGVLCIFYSVLGGIEAVIWSDVLQAVVLFGGAIVVLWACVSGVDGGFSELLSRGESAGKLQVVDLDWDFTRASLPVVILGGIFINLIPYSSDQSVVQRYMTTSDERSARRAIWLGGILAIPASILFFGLGTALFGFYDANPEHLVPLAKTDQILPWFLITEIPAGIAGLVVAGIFAAAMSSLDSSMNSSATALMNDFYHRFQPVRDERRELFLARTFTVALGVLGTSVALVLASMSAQGIFDMWLEIIGLFASGLCGLFVLGIFSSRAGTPSAAGGIIASVVVLFWAKEFTEVSGLTYAAIGVSTCVGVGLIIGLILPTKQDLEGVTIWTLPRGE